MFIEVSPAAQAAKKTKYCSFIALKACALVLFLSVSALAQPVIDTTKFGQHPRLLLSKNDEERIKTLIKQDTLWRNVHQSIITECDAMLMAYPQERTLIGRRLLQVSREALRRVFFLSYAWRITGQKKYLKRGEEELLAVSSFPDWNPDHFLDVAEMTMATAIGYDWLYSGLSPKSRATISKAIIEKGLQTSMNSKYNGWLRASNNWNQVCNGGLTFGAIAVYENQPQLSVNIISRAITSVQTPMKEYAPDGNYKEGYSYWGYGTSYNVFLISAIEKVFGTDFNLSGQPGFMKTAAFYQQLIGVSGIPFNYSDAGGVEGLQPAMFWFANKLNDPSLLFVEKGYLQTSKFNAKTNRLLPAAMIWAGNTNADAIKAPADLMWQAQGENQVAIMRTDWRRYNGIYVGFKGGSPSVSHGHMDVGSFVADFGGTRWSADLGMQQYNSLESAGLSIWEMGQNSQRWDVFRYSNLSHSTLTVNGHKQAVQGDAHLKKASDNPLNMYAVMDLTSVYHEDLNKAERGIAIIDKQYVVVRDEIETGDKECTIRWAMLTPAKVASVEGNSLWLASNGKKLKLQVDGVEGVTLQTWGTDPPHNYDALNPGTILVGFEIKVPAHTRKTFNVYLLPASKGMPPKPTTELKNW
ncbi:heparinase II/III family protein [Mucilaginibacter sp. PAMB04168]|uniref:heparinase II/III domain-containing protein n=1 Tax=Mucilaginibacter sp. PAMB04168 TaxID=3138567 RepID=UPI0031F66FEE